MEISKRVAMILSPLFLLFSHAFVSGVYSASLNVSSFGLSNESPPLMKDPAARIPNNASSPLPQCINFTPFTPNDVTDESADGSSAYRLPSALKPVEYFLRVFPIPHGSQEFDAYVQIDLKVVNSTCQIHLNMANLTLRRESIMITRYDQFGSEIMALREHIFYPEKQVGVFFLERPLQKEDIVRFSVSYSGLLVNNTFGLNHIFYNDMDGIEKRVLATYFQPTGARRVYPCMDEPNLKAHFTIHVGALAGERAMSNMRLLRSTRGANSSSWAIFKKTPLMSPYLVAFVISDFESYPSNKFAKVWGQKSVVPNLQYASLLANKAVDWFQDFLGVSLPLSKLDIVTLPSYAVPGMENWGLITSSEDSLVTNGKTSRDTWVATVTVHEVCHQWVGDLVTPKWWSQYWLSEGFTTFMTALALDELQPSLKATGNMLAEDAQFVRKQDHGENAIILEMNDYNPLENQSKNIPMYFKGASAFRMMRYILGDEVFSSGLKTFFKKYQLKSFTDSDLYTVLENSFLDHNNRLNSVNSLPASLHDIMDSWAKQKGYPLVIVSRTADGGVSVRQQIFEEKNPTSPSTQHKNQTWWIPITIATSRNPDFNTTTPRDWLHPTNDPLVLQGVTKRDSWIVFNVQQMVYLRVNYDVGLWREIASQLKRDHRVIHVLNRAQLLEDSLYLFNAGFLDAEVPMSIMQYLSQEMEYYPMKTAFLYMSSIEIVFRREPSMYPLLKKYLLSILSPHVHGPFGEDHTDKLRRELVLNWSCKMRHPACTAIAKELFQEWKNGFDLELFPEQAMESMLCSVIESGSTEDWEFVYRKFLATTEPKQSKKLIDALVCTKNETIISRYLEDIMSPSNNMTYEDAQNIYMSLSYSLRWNRNVWDYLNSNWDKLKDRFGRAPVPLVTTAYDLEQVRQILASKYKDSPDFNPDVIEQFLESNQKYALENERLISTVTKWLEANYDSFAFS